jgi:hypothetical protein
MGNIGSWFSKNEKNKILSDKDFTNILDELKIKDTILNDEEITEDNLIQKISSAIENKYKFNKNTNRKKYTTGIINDLGKFRDKMSEFKNKYIETNNILYNFILSELKKLETHIMDLQKFLGNIPNNAQNSTNSAVTPAATTAATTAANNASNNAAILAAKSKANPEANPEANSTANPEANSTATPAATPAATLAATSRANPEANSAAPSGANSVVNPGAPSGVNSVVKSEANSRANSESTPNLKKVNIPADPDEIFKLIQDFESKFFNNFFTKVKKEVKKGKISKTEASKTEAKKDTKPDHIFKFLKVLLLYKKLFPTKGEDIDELIKKYSSLCPKVGDTKCGLTKEKMTLGVRINTYNNQSEKIKELGRNIEIEKKTSKNFSGMLDEIIPRSNANNKPVNNPNNKIKHETIEKIWTNIETIKAILDRLRFFSFSEKNGNKTVKTIQQKFLDFIKFLLLFKKIIKDKNKTISSTIDEFIKEYLKRCGTSKDEKEGYSMNETAEDLRERCKSEKTIGDYGRSIYKLINFDKQNNQNNVDKEFKELLKIEWKNDEFNKLKDEFNSMLKYYYAYLEKKQQRVNEEVLLE